MAYKRHIDRLPIIPADAEKHNVTCHYCIVGCGYHAYTWPVNKQGGSRTRKQRVRRRPFGAAARRNGRLVSAIHVQHREEERPGRSHRHQARSRLRGKLRARIGARRPHGRAALFGGAQLAASSV